MAKVPEVAVKPKAVAVVAPVAVVVSHVTTYVATTAVTAPKVKVTTTSPVVGKVVR